MNQTQQEKIKRFLNDKIMSDAVFSVLLESYLKQGKDRDVQNLAASRIAIDLLRDGWRELEKLKDKETTESKPFEQIGL